MYPCGFVRATFGLRVKSAPTSGPLIVSSQVTQAPHGMRPPAQFIIVPRRLVHAPRTSPSSLTIVVVQPLWAIVS
jgi:hypothetical protein